MECLLGNRHYPFSAFTIQQEIREAVFLTFTDCITNRTFHFSVLSCFTAFSFSSKNSDGYFSRRNWSTNKVFLLCFSFAQNKRIVCPKGKSNLPFLIRQEILEIILNDIFLGFSSIRVSGGKNQVQVSCRILYYLPSEERRDRIKEMKMRQVR